MPQPTVRSRQKAGRRAQLLAAAAALFADRGYLGVRLEDLGSAVGVSGPAVYRHFTNKESVLVELLVGISERLLAGGRTAVAGRSRATDQLEALIGFHTEFAVADSALIRIQDRDLAQLPADARHEVRRLQREYVEIWADVLLRCGLAVDSADARTKVQATIGLINSTPHIAGGAESKMAGLLAAMATAALHAVPDGRPARR